LSFRVEEKGYKGRMKIEVSFENQLGDVADLGSEKKKSQGKVFEVTIYL
jgi:hypothetical protein